MQFFSDTYYYWISLQFSGIDGQKYLSVLNLRLVMLLHFCLC
jgi:hypothetical protein